MCPNRSWLVGTQPRVATAEKRDVFFSPAIPLIWHFFTRRSPAFTRLSFPQVVVWHGAVLRGDLNAVRVGAFSSVGARSVLHAARSTPTGLPAATVVGRSVTIGDRCLLRSATVGDGAVLGDGCVLLEGSVVGAGAVLQAGTVLPPGRLVPPAQEWGGKPARHVRDLSKDEVAANTAAADRAAALASSYAAEELPEGGFIYRDAERVRRDAAKSKAA